MYAVFDQKIRRYLIGVLGLALGLCLGALPALATTPSGGTAKGKVLVVMSYDAKNDSEIEIAKGIDQVLAGHDLRYVYLDSKNHLAQAAANAKKAYTLYLEFQPDLLIAADDTAQEVFVLPYILHKVATPVVFCGVNDSAAQYGYPNAQVTGIVEKKHYRQSIDFARLLDPRITKIAVLYRDTPSNAINLAQIKKEEKGYTATVIDYVAVESSAEVQAALAGLEKRADALLVLNLAGISGQHGEKMETTSAMALVANSWPKPTIGASKNEIVAGILCGVAKINLEQGLVAGRMGLEILDGKAPAEIPATENQNGQRVINVKTASRLGLQLKPMLLIGSDLVR